MVFPTEAIELPPLTQTEAMEKEYNILGPSTGEHVIALYKPWLTQQGILGTQALKWQADGQQVRVAGLLVVHQAPQQLRIIIFLL